MSPLSRNVSRTGFTLMELLVVIAVIATLAAVILSALNDARTSGSDAAIKQSIGSIKSQADIYYNQNTYSYSGLCAETNVTAVRAGINDFNGGNGTECTDDNTAWAVSSILVSTSTEWCADSTGFVGERMTALGSGEVVCPAS